jgi:hypothetical protein
MAGWVITMREIRTDDLREAHRCLALDGELPVWESAGYRPVLRRSPAVMSPTKQGLFLRIRALKNAAAPDPNLTLRFRGHESPRTA